MRSWRICRTSFAVVAWDAPGCGSSGDPPEDFGLADYADCLASFCEALELDRPHMLGHSFGGGLALQLGVRHQAVPKSLVVAGGYAGWAGSLSPEEVAARLDLALRLADDLPKPIAPESIPGCSRTPYHPTAWRRSHRSCPTRDRRVRA